ncbi:hypothetical protein L596_012164 [Steinernema carpocapsae]|uniref:Uncharacterized protein n=1 Tax=Steinernema carpocapsae TaxID=34508 RepID=A0A4U5NW62_STECR|nr:hypothetical protein L596_012164 [Steinernema carpocapsae]
MAPRSSVFDHFEEINGFYKFKRCGSRLKKPADGSTGTLREHAKIHGNIESKQDAKRNDDGPPKKLPKLDFADDSYSRSEKILRFFAAFGVPFQAVFFRISDRISNRIRIRIGSDPTWIRSVWDLCATCRKRK